MQKTTPLDQVKDKPRPQRVKVELAKGRHIYLALDLPVASGFRALDQITEHMTT
jgi:hypothetical protein